jgi:hypothetical protein
MPMLFYDVKLVHPQTKEIYFQTISKRLELPPPEVFDRYQGAMLVINTTTFLVSEPARPKD